MSGEVIQTIRRQTIAVDAMGGDYAPGEIVLGAVDGARKYGVDLILVGDENLVKPLVPTDLLESGSVRIVHTTEIIGMHEYVDSVRTKRNSSLVVTAKLVKEGEADAMIFMGNTAASMAAATLEVGRISGVKRPGIAAPLPRKKGRGMLIDGGAVADCTPEQLKQFATLGCTYFQKVLHVSDPKVGILSIGGEEGKGNELTKKAYDLIAQLPYDFVGNVEANNLFADGVDVIVADGFVGNVALKTAEGVAHEFSQHFKEERKKNPLLNIPLALLYKAFHRLKQKMDYRKYGGAPLLGIDGVCIIGHGRSDREAVSNSIGAAKKALDSDIVNALRDALLKLPTPA